MYSNWLSIVPESREPLSASWAKELNEKREIKIREKDNTLFIGYLIYKLGWNASITKKHASRKDNKFIYMHGFIESLKLQLFGLALRYLKEINC